ncbi:MAG: DUF4328 domain-containing protein [Pyrinomonadaceae bacterium]
MEPTFGDTPYRSPKMLSLVAMAGIGADGLLGLTDMLSGAMGIGSPDWALDTGDSETLPIWLIFVGLFSLLKIPVYITGVVAFLMWLYRCYVNLPALMSDSNEFTPGWAVGWWFIPLANLVKPFQAVRSLWSESDPDIDLTTPGFLTNVQAGAPGFMALWWGAWLLSNFASNALSRYFDPDVPATLEVSSYGFVISGTLTAFAAVLALKVIRIVTQRQEQRFAKMGLRQHPEPPPPPTFG